LDKVPNKYQDSEDYLEHQDDSFLHNTTGNKDRKKRKGLKTLVLSSSKVYG
jgi:hypothetical protein